MGEGSMDDSPDSPLEVLLTQSLWIQSFSWGGGVADGWRHQLRERATAMKDP
jgi:hypothetical protein